MSAERINLISRTGVIALSLISFGTVLAGYFQPPQPDEGALAHIFQLSMIAFVPMLLLFLLTADWKRPVRAARQLTLPAAAVTAAFVALYLLEHR
jgi:uncharacterized membrane protein YozB (DUF420 family)